MDLDFFLRNYSRTARECADDCGCGGHGWLNVDNAPAECPLHFAGQAMPAMAVEEDCYDEISDRLLAREAMEAA